MADGLSHSHPQRGIVEIDSQSEAPYTPPPDAVPKQGRAAWTDFLKMTASKHQRQLVLIAVDA